MTTSLSDLPDDIDALKAMVLSMTGVKLGEDVSERLDVIPARFRVIVTRRPKYACKACHEMIVQAAAEPHLVEAGLPTETLLAQTVVSKYADGLPLYRQEGSYARNGVELSRSLMASWMGRVGFHLDLLADRVLEHIRAGTRIFSDGTELPTFAPGTGKTRRLGCGPMRDHRPFAGAGPPMIAYRFEESRGGACVERHLAGFTGLVQVDGYQAYNRLAEPDRPGGPATLAGCWSHCAGASMSCTSPASCAQRRKPSSACAICGS